MAERLSQEAIPTIRFHHLRLWGEFVEKYSEALGDMYPWNLSGESRQKAGMFISDYAYAHTDAEVSVRDHYEELTLNKIGQKDLKYIYDLIGSTQADFDRVLEKRIEVFAEIFNRVSGNKNSLIILNTEPDGICDSCAVGLHCRRTFFQEIVRSDKDFSYMHVLQTLMEQGFGKGPNEVIGKRGRDIMFINGETLFNPEFHKRIADEYRKIIEDGWMAGGS